ncbi:hypothetical protein ScPMuIL_001121 [Solemya velum]
MSHNSKYYNKRLNKKDARGLTRINDLWNLKNSTQQTELLVEESPSPVQQADQSSVGNELNNDHDVDPQPIQSPSKKIKISPVVTVSTTVSLIESEIEKIKTDTRKAGVRLKYEVSTMSGDFVEESQMKFTGINRYFNSYTMRGRFNWVIATYSSLFVGYLVMKRRSAKKAKALEAAKS